MRIVRHLIRESRKGTSLNLRDCTGRLLLIALRGTVAASKLTTPVTGHAQDESDSDGRRS